MLLSEAELKAELNKVTDSLKFSLKSIQTGRPKPEVLENLKVEAYGQENPLKSLTSIEIIDGKFRLQPYDPSVRKDIENAIRNSNLGLNPAVQQDAIYISVPPLTQETRLKKVKEVSELLEEGKVKARKLRHKFLDDIKKLEGVSDDLKKADEKELQKEIDKLIEELQNVAEEKKAEILKV
jgi:ribosome recycling factor